MGRAGPSRGSWGHRAKRWLYLVHRWVGIVSCLLFLTWFVSGLVMVYVPYPSLSRDEVLEGLPVIDWSKVRVAPEQAERIASGGAPSTIVLEMIAAEPVWRVTSDYGPPVTLSASTGAVLGPFTQAQAARTAAAFARAPVVEMEKLERDQWTVGNGFDSHRPLYRVRLGGPDRRDLYVSSSSGAVVQETRGSERFWNWIGSVPHWIYPTVLRQNQPAWRQAVIWIAGPCVLAAITGMWVGILRARFGNRRFKGGRITPYHGWMLWHHIAGLTGGVLLTLWIFSGWLSVDPGRAFDSPGLSSGALWAYAGAETWPATDIARLASVASQAKRIEFSWAAGRPWASVERPQDSQTVDARTLLPAQADRAALIAAAQKLVPEAAIASVEKLKAPDLYWYETGALPRLPVLRIKFADKAGTWAHIDPVSGELLGSIDQRGRTYRWVYELFHTWNLNALTLNRPAWDIFLWTFSLMGIVTSASGVWIGWHRLRGRSAPTRARGQSRPKPNINGPAMDPLPNRPR